MKAASTHKQAWRWIRPKVVLKVTWAEAAAHGTTLPQELRTELDTLRRNERDENRSWSEFSDARAPSGDRQQGDRALIAPWTAREGSSAHLSRQKLSVP